MSETGAMPGDSHFIDWGLLGKQILAERRRLLVIAAAAGTAAGSKDGSEVLLRGLGLLSCVGPHVAEQVHALTCHGFDRDPVEPFAQVVLRFATANRVVSPPGDGAGWRQRLGDARARNGVQT